jgi:ATP-dependent DNA helicase RecQ
LASEQGVPPYIIFHDSTLKEMVRYRPLDREQLKWISGIGKHKLGRYGDQFLKVIRKHSGKEEAIPEYRPD